MTSQLNSITRSAHGKINWTLDVFDRRPDGYHEIASILQQIELADLVTVQKSDSGIHLTISGPEAAGVPSDETNIVRKAAQALGIRSGAITIEKNIPSQAGLGGGSSDAASALVALNRVFELGLSADDLKRIGATLGADVPFFLTGSSARVGGFGEITEAIDPLPVREIIIVKPEVGVSTAAAYAALDQIPGRSSKNATAAWPHTLPSNDFEEAVFALSPGVAAARDAMRKCGVTGTLLCGSGAAVFGWGDDLASSAKTLRRNGFEKVWITRTVR